MSLEFTWSAEQRALEPTVLADLRAGFRGRDIDICLLSDAPAHAPIAAIVIRRELDPAIVSVEIRDTLTDKRVARDVELSRVPLDGQAFAIAIATDELVWASWAELALERRARSERPPPPQVERAVRRDLPSAPPPAESRRTRLGTRAAFEGWSAGQLHVGGDVNLSIELGARFALDVNAGLRDGFEVRGESGDIGSSALGVATALRVPLLEGAGVRLGLPIGARLAWVNLRGQGDPGNAGYEFTGTMLAVRTGLDLDLKLAGPLWLELGGDLGHTLRGVEATDTGRVVTGASGVEFGAHLGVGVEL